MKANVRYFSVVLFIMFYMVILHATFYPNPFKSILAWNHLFSTTLLNYIGISLVFSVRNTSLASKRIIQTWLSNSHGCDVIHVCRQLNAATIIECKSREWCVAFLLAWYDTKSHNQWIVLLHSAWSEKAKNIQHYFYPCTFKSLQLDGLNYIVKYNLCSLRSWWNCRAEVGSRATMRSENSEAAREN